MALKYPLHSLGWYGFETLAQTLLKAVIGPGVSAFGGSRDNGRDAEYRGVAAFPSAEEQWSGHWIFQAKFAEFEGELVQGAIASLRNSFRSEMRANLRRRGNLQLNLDNYVLITNVPLSGDDRDSLHQIAKDANVAQHFAVVDGRDVCELLDVHPHVRRSFPQLLALADFAQVVNSATLSASAAYLERWRQHLGAFVATSAYHDAGVILQTHHFLVLDGAPEAGKSTIAAALALEAAARNVEVYSVRRPEDIHRVRKHDTTQLFVADDALGSVSVDISVADDWSRELPNVLATLRPNGYLIWTGRTYVMGAALDRLRLDEAVEQFPGAHGLTVAVGELTQRERAGMLYNHVKRQDFPENVRKLVREMASEIVAHPNVTPERLRALAEVVLRSPEVSANDVRQFLSNPSKRWMQAYDNLSESERAVLSSVLHHASPASEELLRTKYEAYTAKSPESSLDFETALERLSPGFLRIASPWPGQRDVDFAHPSIRDFVIARHRENEERRRRYFELASIDTLSAVARALRADASNAQDQGRGVAPKGSNELELLGQRFVLLVEHAQNVAQIRHLLTAAAELRPLEKRHFVVATGAEIEYDAVVAPADVRSEWASSEPGILLSAVVDACCRTALPASPSSLRLEEAEGVLNELRRLVPYCSPMPRVVWLADEVRHAARSHSASSVSRAALLNAARAFEPLLVESLVTRTTLKGILDGLLSSTDEALSEGLYLKSQYDEKENEFPDPYDFRNWHGGSARLINVIDGFTGWAEALTTEHAEKVDSLRHLLQVLVEPPENYGPEAHAEGFRVPVSDWSIEEMFADL